MDNCNTLQPLPNRGSYLPDPDVIKPEPTYTVKNFTNVAECINYIVPLIICKVKVMTYLNRLETDKGIIVTNMPIFRYDLQYDVEQVDKTSLNRLEFRDGPVYSILCVDKLFGWVTSQNIGLGNLVSIDLTTRVVSYVDRYHDERYGEHEITPAWL